MSDINKIESFVKKYRNAISSKSKDIRISIDEAADIITAFALVNANSEVASMLKAINMDVKDLKSMLGSNNQGSFDGGSF